MKDNEKNENEKIQYEIISKMKNKSDKILKSLLLKSINNLKNDKKNSNN